MNYSQLDIQKMMQAHKQQLRNSLEGEPTAGTLAAWRLEDAHDQFMMNYYMAQEEAAEPLDLNISSEVKVMSYQYRRTYGFSSSSAPLQKQKNGNPIIEFFLKTMGFPLCC